MVRKSMVVPPRFQGDRRFVFGERRAFTLVELLVLGVIIALSVGLVAPSLDVARQQSMHALCLNRLGAIGDATTIYTTDDPEEFALPLHPLWTAQDPQDPSYIGAYEWGGQSGVGGPYVVPGPGGEYEFLNSKYGTRAGFGPATRPLNTILYPHGFVDNLHTDVGYDRHGAAKDTQLRLDAYKCPADDGPPGGGHCPPWIEHADRSAYDHFGTSYSANKFMTSFVGGGPITTNSPFLRPVTRVPSPARTIAYEETIGRWAWACKREKGDCRDVLGTDGIDPGPTKAVRGWHGKNWMFSRVFGDAHAEYQKVFIEGTKDSDDYSEHYRTELVYPNDLNKQASRVCIIVRGDGWQVDTLPDEPIFTGMWWDGWDRVSFDGCVRSD